MRLVVLGHDYRYRCLYLSVTPRLVRWLPCFCPPLAYFFNRQLTGVQELRRELDREAVQQAQPRGDDLAPGGYARRRR